MVWMLFSSGSTILMAGVSNFGRSEALDFLVSVEPEPGGVVGTSLEPPVWEGKGTGPWDAIGVSKFAAASPT